MHFYFLLSPSSLASTWIKSKTNWDWGCKLCWCLAATCLLSAIAPARFGDLHSTVAHCHIAVKMIWSVVRARLLSQKITNTKSNEKRQKQTKTVCSTLGGFGMLSNFPSSSQGQFLHVGIQSTLSFALNPSGLLLLNLLYTSPFCCPWPNQWRFERHNFLSKKKLASKALKHFYFLLSPSSLASTGEAKANSTNSI